MQITTIALLIASQLVLGSLLNPRLGAQTGSRVWPSPSRTGLPFDTYAPGDKALTTTRSNDSPPQVDRENPHPFTGTVVPLKSEQQENRAQRLSSSDSFANRAAEPNDGKGTDAEITYAVSHPGGAHLLAYVYTHVAATNTPTDGCYIRYDIAASRLNLLNDAGSGWITSGTSTDPGVLSNQHCSVSRAFRVSIESGVTLKLSISYHFAARYAGAKTVYMYSQDTSGQITGWTPVGVWHVPEGTGNFLPSITAMAPISGHMSSLTLRLTATDPDGAQDLRGIHVLLNNNLQYGNSCYLYFDPTHSELFLLNDNTSRFLGPLRLGDTADMQNGKCSIRGETVRMSSDKDSVSLEAQIDLTVASAGPNSLWTLTEDSSPSWIGWKHVGEIIVPLGPGYAPPSYEDLLVTPTTTGSFLITTTISASKAIGTVEDIYFMINTEKRTQMGCYIMLRRSAQKMYFLGDDGVRWQDIDTIGSNRYASNQSCGLDYRNAQFRIDGDKAKVQIEVSPHIIPNQPLYMWLYISDSWGMTTGWAGGSTLPLPISAKSSDLSIVLPPGSSISTGGLNSLPPQASWRVEFFAHEWSKPPSMLDGFIRCSALGFQIAVAPNGDMEFVSANGRMTLPTSGREAFTVRIQKLTASKMYAFEVWNLDGSSYVSRQLQVGQWQEQATAGCAISNTLAESFAPAIGYFRLNNSTVPLGAKQPVPAEAGDLLDWKFEGYGNDSGPHHWPTMLLGGRFGVTTGADTLFAIPVVEGFETAPPWMIQPVVNAREVVRLSGERSVSMLTSGGAMHCNWKQLPHADGEPVSSIITISAANACSTTLSNLTFGPYKIQLTVSDSTGKSASQQIEFGAVEADEDGLVEYPDSRLRGILGPMLVLGRNPWVWADRQSVEMARYLWKRYEVNGGTWRLESDLRVLGGIERRGTVYTENGIKNKLFGVGTNFLEVFCGGVPGKAKGATPYIVPMVPNAVVPQVTNPYPRLISTCESDTEVTFIDGWVWERPAIGYPGVTWGTTESCGDCGDWRGIMSTSNINYYDNALGHYALYYRTGWKIARDSARWLADRWYRSPWALSGLSVPPRDLSYTSTFIRAEIDPIGANSEVMWATLRQMVTSPPCIGEATNPGAIGDIRESAYCLAYLSLQAKLDPDANARGTSVQALRAAFEGRWGPEQTVEGTYVEKQFEGDFARVVEVADGSPRVTLHKGPGFSTDYCGKVSLEGAGQIWNDRVTLEAAGGVSFVGQQGKMIMLTGRLNGQPWSMVSSLSFTPVTVSSRAVLQFPWRGDPGPIDDFAIFESQPAGRGYWETFMAETDAEGKLLSPPALDAHAWYWCRVESPSALVLDKPYVAEIGAKGPFRRMTWQGGTGLGTQPFMLGILGWAFHLAADAVANDDPSTANGYRESARRLVRWLHAKGLNPVTNGMRYRVGHSNCQGVDLAPAFGCWETNKNVERSYNIELFNLISRDLLAFGTEAVPGFGDELYTATYGKPGFTSPFAGDGHFAEAADESGYTWSLDLATKNYGQAWGVGGGQTWPAVRLMLRK